MSTRSMIGVLENDGTLNAVYCHWDGDFSWNGRILQEHYNSEEKAKALVALGSLSVLKERLAPNKGEKHSFDEPLDNVTIAYHRDRNEPGPDIEHYQALGDLGYAFGKICNEAYAYIFVESEGLWYGMKCPWGDEPAEYQLLQDILDELENT